MSMLAQVHIDSELGSRERLGDNIHGAIAVISDGLDLNLSSTHFEVRLARIAVLEERGGTAREAEGLKARDRPVPGGRGRVWLWRVSRSNPVVKVARRRGIFEVEIEIGPVKREQSFVQCLKKHAPQGSVLSGPTTRERQRSTGRE